jgi:rhodanese-related sulfurtransferase
MNRRFLAETLALLSSAVLCAAVANLVASRERKLSLPGSYPNAMTYSTPGPASPKSDAPAMPTPPPDELGAPIVQAESGERPVADSSKPVKTARTGTIPTPPPAPAPRRPTADEVLSRFPAHPSTPSLSISGEDAAALHAAGSLFVDARRSKEYETGHVAGALSISVWESDATERILQLVNEGRRPELPIVVYCSGGECEDSHMLSEKLFGAGFTNALVYKDGWPDWLERGGASKRGPQP